MSIESQDAQIKSNDNLSKMIEHKFGISRENFKKNNRQRLAKMAGVSTQEYTGKKAQNELIRKKILKNEILPLQKYATVVKKFSPLQQNAITEAFSSSSLVNTYLRSLKDTQIDQFKKLSPTQLVSFLDQETKIIQVKKEEIKHQKKINEQTIEQLLSLNELDNVAKKIENFIAKYGLKELERDKATGVFVDKKTEQDFQIFTTQFTNEQKTTYETLKTTNGQLADTFARNLYQTKMLQTPEIQAKLSKEAKLEFTGIVEEFYIASKKLDIDMSSFGLEAMYQKAKAYLVETYMATDTYQKLSYNIQSAPAVNTYFTANKKTELIAESSKNKSYYTKLLSWYPVLDTVYEGKKISEYLSYLNDDMTIKTEIPSQQKTKLTSLLTQLKEQSKPYENKLLGLTNSLVQTTAVEQCITTLQSYMDVNISEKENVMEQLKIAENRDAVSENLIVKINGTLNGKKVVLSYDLLTGKVSYQSFMTKQTDTDQSPITIGDTTSEESIPLITLPKFGDFIQASNNIEYKNVIEQSSTQAAYTQKITEILTTSAQSHQDMDNEKDMLKKYILKDMITQNIFSLTGRTMDGLPNSLSITSTQYPQMHAFYTLITKSLTYYSMGSVDGLSLFQHNIQTLLDNATGPAKTQSMESVLAYKEKNKEMFVVQSLLNQSNIPVVTSSLSNQQPEEKLLSFFRCFEKKTAGVSIIDGEMMNDFFSAASGTNNQENAVGKRKRGSKFNKLVDDGQNTMDVTSADALLQTITE